MMLCASKQPRLVLGLLHLVCPGADRNVHAPSRSIYFLECRKRYLDEAVARETENGAFLFRHTDDLVLMPINLESLTDRIETGKQLFRYVGSDKRDEPGMDVFPIHQRA